MNRFRRLALACAAAAVVGAGDASAAHAGDAKPVVPAFACQYLPDLGDAFGIIAGDWNRDGRLDLAISHRGSVTAFLADGRRAYTALPEVAVGSVARGMAAADLDADGDLDLAVPSGGKHQTVLLDNDGSGHFSVGRTLQSGFAPFSVALADLDGNGKRDLVVVNETNGFGSGVSGTVAVFFDLSPETRDPILLQAGVFPSDGQVADFDGRPGLDLAITNWGSGTLSVFLNNGDRTFKATKQITYGGQLPYSLYAADFDGDGKMDLAVTDVSSGGVWILDGDGQGGFATRGQIRVGQGVRSVTGGDINGDGHLDLFTADTTSGTVSIVLGKAGGEFGEAVAVAVGDKPRMVMARDLNGDGRLDLAVTLAGTGAVALLFQTDGTAVPCPRASPRGCRGDGRGRRGPHSQSEMRSEGEMAMRGRGLIALLVVMAVGGACARSHPPGRPAVLRPEQKVFIWAEAEPDEGRAPLAVALTCDAMEEIENPTFSWDFGDGSPPSTEQNPKHVYGKPGQYTARVTLIDPDGNVGEDVLEILVEAPAAP